jgi:hypothetical protein
MSVDADRAAMEDEQNRSMSKSKIESKIGVGFESDEKRGERFAGGRFGAKSVFGKGHIPCLIEEATSG